jgi:hypothetical protein
MERASDLLIRVPTGLGKTAGTAGAWTYHRCLRGDVAWPTRLVFCLPMRVLVEQTEAGVRSLRAAAGLADRVGGHVLMGGADAGEWDLEPERPAVLIGTQDVLLSRALNRGYASPRARWPVEFGPGGRIYTPAGRCSSTPRAGATRRAGAGPRPRATRCRSSPRFPPRPTTARMTPRPMTRSARAAGAPSRRTAARRLRCRERSPEPSPWVRPPRPPSISRPGSTILARPTPRSRPPSRGPIDPRGPTSRRRRPGRRPAAR